METENRLFSTVADALRFLNARVLTSQSHASSIPSQSTEKRTPSCHIYQAVYSSPRLTRFWDPTFARLWTTCAPSWMSMAAEAEPFRRRKCNAQCEWTRPPIPLSLLWHLLGPMPFCSQLLLLDVSESQRRLGQTMNWRGVCGQTRWRNTRNHRRPYCVGPPWFAVAEHPCPQREAQWDHRLGEFGVVSVPLATSRAAQHSCGISKTHMCCICAMWEGGRWVPARDGGCIPGIKDAAILPSSISGCNSRIRLPWRHDAEFDQLPCRHAIRPEVWCFHFSIVNGHPTLQRWLVRDLTDSQNLLSPWQAFCQGGVGI